MPVTRIRHVALWLIVAACVIAYANRAVFGVAAMSISHDFGLDRAAMGLVVGGFNLGYALFQIPGGWLGDKIGPRRALALVVICWSLFASATALAWNIESLVVFRFLLGACQAGTFAIATRSLVHWTLPAERGWAQGIMHGGIWLGAFITPPIAQPFIVGNGWRVPVVFLGLLGIGWAAIWFFWYRDTPAEHSWINEAERNLIQYSLETRPVKTKFIPWRVIFSSRAVWALSAMYACFGYGLFVHLAYFPPYLVHGQGRDLSAIDWYAGPILGAVLGGWLSDSVSHRTGNVNMARRTIAISGLLLAAVSIILAMLPSNVKTSILGYAGGFGLGMTAGVSWAVLLDIGHDYAGSVAGVMNMAGNIGGAVSSVAIGYFATRVGFDAVLLVSVVMCIAGALLFTRIDASRALVFSGEFGSLRPIEQVFHEALELPKAERRAFLEASYSGDAERIREIESLLWHHDQGTTPLERALCPVASNLLTISQKADEICQGTMLGPYRIDSKLGEGGMGTVYAATDNRLERRVAVKIVKRALAFTPEARAQFLREARSAAALAHSNIAVVHDVGETDEIAWIVMEYVTGTSLRSKLQADAIIDGTLLTYAVQLADALEHAHTRRIIHGDIKPENILLTDEGNLKVIDFGLARLVSDESDTVGATNSRTFAGTLAYAAPELVAGSGMASSRSDIYSAGIVLHEIAYGHHPFAGLSGRTLVDAILTGDPPAVNVRETPIASSMAAVVARCLSRDPAARYRDGAELANALRSSSEAES